MRRFVRLFRGSAVLVAASLALGLVSSAKADVLHRFSTNDATFANTGDDGYDPNEVTVQLAPNVNGPADATQLASGNVGLDRFWNSEWAGFTMAANNSDTLEEAEFANGYFTWTVSAGNGFLLQLQNLSFPSARGGTSNIRGFKLYAAVNGGSFSFFDTPLIDVPAETGVRATPVNRTGDLSGAAFQNIQSIMFRYYPLTTTVGNSMDFAFMELNGSVVPEPAGLLLLPGVMLLAGRRRKATR